MCGFWEYKADLRPGGKAEANRHIVAMPDMHETREKPLKTR